MRSKSFCSKQLILNSFFLSLLTLLFGCGTTPPVEAGLWGADCTPSTGVQPVWLNAPGQLPNINHHVYATGVAEHQDSLTEQKKAALSHAQANLAESILVHVKTSFKEIATRSGTDFSSSIQAINTSIADVMIPGIKAREEWMDDECRLHMLVSVPKPIATLITKRRLLDELEHTARTATIPLLARQQAIKQALSLTNEFEFGQLDISLNSQQLRHQLCPLHKHLSNGFHSLNWGLLLMNSTGFSSVELDKHGLKLKPELDRFFPGLTYSGTCTSLATCQGIASQLGLRNILIAKAKFDVTDSLGTYHGKYWLSLRMHTATSQSTVKELNPRQVINVMHHQRSRVTANIGFQKWVGKFSHNLTEFASQASQFASKMPIQQISSLCTK